MAFLLIVLNLNLKPKNIMVDTNGYIKLVFFEFVEKLDKDKTFSLYSIPDYLAPEVITNEGHDWGKIRPILKSLNNN